MEPRKIVVVSTKTQKKSVIMSAATTLGELKADLDANNIDYNNMDFYEGTAKVQLKTDDSILPHDVPYKGTITNELVFMLTTMNKKITSGATEDIDTMNRAEAYKKVKELGIQQEIFTKFGKNFTQCSTKDIKSMIKKHIGNASPVKKEEEKPCSVEEIEEVITSIKELPDNNPQESKEPKKEEFPHLELEALVEDLAKRVTALEVKVKAMMGGKTHYEEEEDSEYDSAYSDEDIDDMFDFVD